LALFAILVLLKPWSPFGLDPAAFDAGWRSPEATSRAFGLAGAAATLAVLAGLVWAVWVLLARLRRRKTADARPTGGARGGFARSAVVLALWGWLILGIMSLGAVRLYHRYDARLQDLTIQDVQDEVAAWMGPSWQRSFFPGP